MRHEISLIFSPFLYFFFLEERKEYYPKFALELWQSHLIQGSQRPCPFVGRLCGGIALEPEK